MKLETKIEILENSPYFAEFETKEQLVDQRKIKSFNPALTVRDLGGSV